VGSPLCYNEAIEFSQGIMLLGFKTELKLNNHQRTILKKHAGTARHAWNIGHKAILEILEHNKNHPESKLKFPSAIDLHKWLVAAIKPDYPWYYEVSKCAPQYALRYLVDAWKRCFEKIASRPRFKRKGKQDSFTLDGTIKITDHYQMQVPKIGKIKTYERLPLGYTPKSVTISRRADRWFISFKLELELSTHSHTDVIGVDLGILNFATVSNGQVFDSPKPLKKLGKKLGKLQWRNRNKVLHSNNWKKAQLKIARQHLKIANARQDFLHKTTTDLAKNHGVIVIEDLNVKGMMANHCLAKAISDCGFYEFRRQLSYKCELSGTKLIISDRWFASSKTCSNCEYVKESLPLSERTFICEHCGLSLDRDLNAAINLSKVG
jgi:putative transposase